MCNFDLYSLYYKVSCICFIISILYFSLKLITAIGKHGQQNQSNFFFKHLWILSFRSCRKSHREKLDEMSFTEALDCHSLFAFILWVRLYTISCNKQLLLCSYRQVCQIHNDLYCPYNCQTLERLYIKAQVMISENITI